MMEVLHQDLEKISKAKATEVWQMPVGWGGVGEDPSKWCEKMPGFCQIIEENGLKYLRLTNKDKKSGDLGWSVDVLKVCQEIVDVTGKENFILCLDLLNRFRQENGRVTDLGRFLIDKNDNSRVFFRIKTEKGDQDYYFAGSSWMDEIKKNSQIIKLEVRDIVNDPGDDTLTYVIVGLVTFMVLSGAGRFGSEVVRAWKRDDQRTGERIEDGFKRAKNNASDEEAESIAKLIEGLDKFVIEVREDATGEKSQLVSKSEMRKKEEDIRKLSEEIIRQQRGIK